MNRIVDWIFAVRLTGDINIAKMEERKINRDLHGHTQTVNYTEQNMNRNLPSFSSIPIT